MDNSRRSFIVSSSAILALLGSLDESGISAQSNEAPRFFDFRSHYSYPELNHLYRTPALGSIDKLFSAEIPATHVVPSPPAVSGSIFYYCDPQTSQLINPFNLKPDASFKSGSSYMLKSSIYNFHTSSSDLSQIWSKDVNNAQLTFQAAALDPFAEELTWIVLAGLNMVSSNLKGSDKQSLNVGTNNQLTSSTSPSDSIIISDGQISLTLGIAAQKKKSFWDTLVTIFGAVANSPLFGLLPLPKLASSTVSALSTLLGQIEQQNRLIPVLAGKQLDFRLYDAGSDQNPFVLKPGFWVVLNADQASTYVDAGSGENFKKNIVLDIPSQQYALVDTNNGNKPVDLTYAVSRVQLPQYNPSPH